MYILSSGESKIEAYTTAETAPEAPNELKLILFL